MNITLVIDQYTGKFTSLERVKQYGFTDVKISREIVSQITKDKARLDELSALIQVRASEDAVIDVDVLSLDQLPDKAAA